MIAAGYADVFGICPPDYWRRMHSATGFQSLNQHAIPILLYGDEATCKGTSWMVLTWQSEICPRTEDAIFSRHLIGIIPSEAYLIDEDTGINSTLQEALQLVVSSLSTMATEGIGSPDTFFFECIGVKGDWKFHRQCFNMTLRHYNRNEFCYWCEGTMDLSLPVTDLSEAAGWKRTAFNLERPPWQVEPVLCQLRMFTMKFIMPDILHIWHLGTGRDLVASALVLLMKKRNFFPGRNMKLRFKSATAMLQTWNRQHGKGLPRKWKLSKKKINMKGGQDATLRDKGATMQVLLAWLVDLLSQRDPGDNLLFTCLWAALHSIGFLSSIRKKIWMTSEEMEQVTQVGYCFCSSYLHLHEREAGSSCLLFKVRPKWHLVHHALLLPFGDKNPAGGLCFIDEDFLKKLMAIMRRTHVLTSPLTTLQRWLMGLTVKFDAVLFELRRDQGIRC